MELLEHIADIMEVRETECQQESLNGGRELCYIYVCDNIKNDIKSNILRRCMLI